MDIWMHPVTVPARLLPSTHLATEGVLFLSTFFVNHLHPFLCCLFFSLPRVCFLFLYPPICSPFGKMWLTSSSLKELLWVTSVCSDFFPSVPHAPYFAPVPLA